MGELVILGGTTTLDIPVERVLSAALERADNFERVLVIAVPKDDKEDNYYASSTGNKTLSLWDVEQFKKDMFDKF